MKNIKLLLAGLLFLITFCLKAQPSIEWQKCLGGTDYDRAYSIQQTIDGGYIVAGHTASINGDVSTNHGYEDYWLIKLTSIGVISWQKCFGGTLYDYATSVQQTLDGGYIVAGYVRSTNGDVAGNHGVNDYWVVKLTSSGNITWQKCLGGTLSDQANSIQQTVDGGYIVVGGVSSTNGDVIGNHGNIDYWAVKLTSTGTIDWKKCLGGSSNDVANSVKQTIDGGYIIAGESQSNDGDVTGNHGDKDYWVVKLDSTGTLDWQKTLGGTGADIAESIQQTTDGGYIVAGYSSSTDGDVTGNHGSYDYWVVKLTSTGAVDWQKCLGGTYDDNAKSIQQTSDGGYVVAGYSSSPDGDVLGCNGRSYWVVKLTYTGAIDWQKCLGGGNGVSEAYSIQQTSDGGYVVAGWTDGTSGDVTGNHGTNDCWIVKLSSDCDVTASYTTINNTNGNYTFTNTSTGTFNQTHLAFGDGTTSTVASPNHTFSANGTYVVVLTVNDSTSSSCMDYYLDTIVVTGVVAPLQCAAGFVMYPDAGGVTVVNSSTGTNLTYFWNFGDGDTSTLQFPTHTYAASGPYYLCLTIDDGAGCVDMYCDSIGENGVVFNKQTGFTINVIAPPLVTQISEQAAITSAMSIYPNPTGKKLNVVFNKNEQYQLKIVTIDGKLIETKTIVGNTTLDVSNYSSGMYFITATNNEGKVYQSKFVKE